MIAVANVLFPILSVRSANVAVTTDVASWLPSSIAVEHIMVERAWANGCSWVAFCWLSCPQGDFIDLGFPLIRGYFCSALKHLKAHLFSLYQKR